MLISELVTTERVISIVGLAKNTGKTVCLGQLIFELHQKGKRLGITSIGRDGEKYDAINAAIAKPPIRVPAGTLVSSTVPLFEKGAARYRVLRNTGIRTPLGGIVIAEMMDAGDVEVAGPTTNEQTRQVCQWMLGRGADCTLVDGALNRKATACPELSDALIISTGAVLSPDLDEVVELTRSQIAMLTVPPVEDEAIAKIVVPRHSRMVGVQPDGAVVGIDADPWLDGTDQWIESVPQGLRYLVFRSVLVEAVIESLVNAGRKDVVFVVADSSKLFVSHSRWRLYQQQGIRVRVQRSAKLLGLTVNPVSPEAHEFCPTEFLLRMKALGAVDNVFNLRSQAYQEQASLRLGARA